MPTDTIDLTNPVEIAKSEKLLVELNPLNLVEHKFLTIKTKSEQLIKLELNSVQKIILAIIKKLMAEKKPIRLLILKARQTGCSTLIQAICYAFTSQKKGINAMVIADDIKGSNYIFDMQKLFYEVLEKHLKPKLKHSNEKKLEFEGIHSQVLIDTAENKNVGRKFTLQYAHLSEAAFFPDLDTIMLGLSQSVPNKPGTMIVIESTANGVGNGFYNRWEETVKGKSDWKAIFIPWFELPEYSMPLGKDGLYPIDNLKGDKTKFLKEEPLLRQKHNLTSEQINWRRWCIINNCNGEVNLFRQEYPSTWQEAFIMSGDLFFNRDALLVQEEKARAECNKKRYDGVMEKFPKIGDIVRLDGKYVFRECEEGRFRIYEKPIETDQYCIGADTAEGLAHGDDNAAIGINKKTNKTACAYNCQCDTDEFAQDLIKMGYFYNSAMVAPENKGYGTNVCKKLYNHYGNVFRKIRDKDGGIDVTDELGYNTNSVTRPQMLGQLREEILEGSTDLLDEELLTQCRTFINNPKKKRPEGEAGKKDDLVFARAIAGMVRHYYPSGQRRSPEQSPISPLGVGSAANIRPNQGYGFKTS